MSTRLFHMDKHDQNASIVLSIARTSLGGCGGEASGEDSGCVAALTYDTYASDRRNDWYVVSVIARVTCDNQCYI